MGKQVRLQSMKVRNENGQYVTISGVKGGGVAPEDMTQVITESNRNAQDSFPSNKAITVWTDEQNNTLIKVQGSRPSENTNKIWVDTSEVQEIEIPDMDDLDLKEDVNNKVSVINEGNRESTTLYPSVKAVMDQVEPVKDEVDQLNESIDEIHGDGYWQKSSLAGFEKTGNLFDGSWGWTQGNYNNPNTNYMVKSPLIPIVSGEEYTFAITEYNNTITIGNAIARWMSDDGTSPKYDVINNLKQKCVRLTAPSGATGVYFILNTGNTSIPITPQNVKDSGIKIIIVKGMIADRTIDINGYYAIYKSDWYPTYVINTDWLHDFNDATAKKLSVYDFGLEIGALSTVTGGNYETFMQNRVRTRNFVYVESDAAIRCAPGYQFFVAEYSRPNTSALIGMKQYSSDEHIVKDACYVRICIKASDDHNFSSPSDVYGALFVNAYQSKIKKIERYSLARVVTDIIGNPYEYKGTISSVPNPAGNLHNIYDAWDRLLAQYPDFMTRSSLGKDATGNYEIREYTISSHASEWKLRGQAYNAHKPLKVLWCAAIHGNEPYMPYEDLRFFTDLLENHYGDDTLRMLWNNVDFHIIPIGNPYGYDHNQYTTSTGVNINRNCPLTWVQTPQGDNYYSGASPASEPETLAIVRWIANNNDAFLFVNRHGTNTFTDAKIFAYTTSRYETDRIVGEAVGKELDGYIKANYPWVLGDQPSNAMHNIFGCKMDKFATGTLDAYANLAGMHGILIECGNVLGSDYPNGNIADVQRIGSTAVGRILSAYVRNNEYMLSDDIMWQETDL